MLCIICTKKKLLAGVKTEDPQLLTIKGKTHINYENLPPHNVIRENLNDIVEAYNAFAKENNLETGDAIDTAIAFPVDMNEYSREKVLEVIDGAENQPLMLVHTDNLVLSYLQGLRENNTIDEDNCLVLEAVDDYTNLCYSLKNETAEPADIKELGKDALFQTESFEFYPFKDFGLSTGKEKVLNELLTEFSAAGLSVDVKGQTDLALQLMQPNEDFTFNVSKSTDSVNLEAEIQLTEDRYFELFTTNKEKIGDHLKDEALNDKGVKKVVLLGDFLRNKALQAYLEQDLKMNGKLVRPESASEKQDIFSIISGLSERANQVIEAERIRLEEEERRRLEEEKRRLEEEKRRKITAELKVKEERDALLAEIQQACVDPAKKEEYEQTFVGRGEKLGIPDLVIKWNISEVLSKIELTKEIDEVSLVDLEDKVEVKVEDKVEEEVEDQVEVEDEKEVDTSDKDDQEAEEEQMVNGNQQEESEKEEELKEEPVGKEEEKAEEEVLVEEKSQPEVHTKVEVETEPELQPVGVAQETSQPAKMVAATKEKMADPVAKLSVPVRENGKEKEKIEAEVKAETETEAKVKEAPKTADQPKKDSPAIREKAAESGDRDYEKEIKNAKMSLNDLFLIKGALKDDEFSTKKVTLYADHEPRVVRVLSAKDVRDPEKVKRFLKLYDKELAYYMEMSELGVAKEGLYYFRDYIERFTLKDHVSKTGLDKKLNIEDLSSGELKFILQVFREVRELNVPHGNISEDNILVVSKRKWNLQKNVEIKFVGFTPDDATPDEMIEQTHKVFGKLLGEEFYSDFREKFQL